MIRRISLTPNDATKERHCQHWRDLFLFHMVSAMSIVLADVLVWFLSLQAHTLPLTSDAILVVMTVVGGAWWVVGAIKGDMAYCFSDFAINDGIALGTVFAAWILLSWVQACLVTVFAILWVALIRIFPSFPLQYRTKKRVYASSRYTPCAMSKQEEQRQEGAVVRASAALAAGQCWHEQTSQRIKIIVQQQRAKGKGRNPSLSEEIRPLNWDQLAIQAAQDYLTEDDSVRHLSHDEIIAIFQDEFQQFFRRL